MKTELVQNYYNAIRLKYDLKQIKIATDNYADMKVEVELLKRQGDKHYREIERLMYEQRNKINDLFDNMNKYLDLVEDITDAELLLYNRNK